MTHVEQLAAFVVRATYEDLSEEARQELKIHVLDALGCAIGALKGPPIKVLAAQIEEFGGNPLVSLIAGGKTAPDRAAFYNAALVRYLDFNDTYLAKHETCHPSDNLGAVLAASEYAGKAAKNSSQPSQWPTRFNVDSLTLRRSVPKVSITRPREPTRSRLEWQRHLVLARRKPRMQLRSAAPPTMPYV
jgi:hypothetical protein